MNYNHCLITISLQRVCVCVCVCVCAYTQVCYIFHVWTNVLLEHILPENSSFKIILNYVQLINWHTVFLYEQNTPALSVVVIDVCL